MSLGAMAFTRKEGGRKTHKLLWGRGIKNRGQIRKQKAEYKIQTREGKGIKKRWGGKEEGGGGGEEMSKWLSGFFIVSPINTPSSTGSSAQRFL